MSKKVLIVDDATIMRSLIRKALKEHGYTVVAEAVDGVDAIEKYKQFSPDFVTMDITMPNMNGLKAIEKIIELDSEANIIMISVVGQKAIVLDALLAGAKHYILKPITTNKLIKTFIEVEAQNCC